MTESIRRISLILLQHILPYRLRPAVALFAFVEPILALSVVVVGIRRFAPSDQTTDYVTVGLVMASALVASLEDTSIRFFRRLRYQRTYEPLWLTPVKPVEVTVAVAALGSMRGLLASLVLMPLVLTFTSLSLFECLQLLPASLLMCFATASIAEYAATLMRTWLDFDLFGLFVALAIAISNVLFPAPDSLVIFAWLSPLKHGVDLARADLPADAVAIVTGVILLASSAVGCQMATARRLGLSR